MRLIVNGINHSIAVHPEMPLLWVLRDVLQMRGTKFGCGVGLCGACTVHVNGVPQRSCSITAGSVDGKKVTTIEGLSSAGDHPVQKAWTELDVPQCGYCQAGQLMMASWLIREKPDPTAKDIDEAMSGNLCRCGTYLRIRKAIARAAEIARGGK